MKNKLKQLGFNDKQIDIYLYLVEYGISPASEISKHLNIPKSTVNFIADNLWKDGFLSKSYKAKTGYYEAEINNLEKNIISELEKKKNIICEILPELKQKNKNVISRPKITFIDGVDNCKKSYLEILKTKEVFYEFGAHKDLEDAFGKDFMNNFISSRVKNNLFCDSIGHNGIVEKNLAKKDKDQLRNLKIFDEKFGNINSSIAIYDDKVLILNLNGVYSGVLIENRELSDTMKTIFKICKKN